MLVTSGGSELQLFDLPDNARRVQMPHQSHFSAILAFSGDGRRLACGGDRRAGQVTH